MYDSLAEIRPSDCIFVRCRAYRIETECGEHVPCGCLSVVLVTAIAVRSRAVKPVHYFLNMPLGLVRLSGPVIKINHVLCRLVSMCVIAHVCDLHLRYLMYAVAVVAVVIYRRNHEYGVEHCAELLCSAHLLHKAVHIVENGPCVMPCVAFCERVTPFVCAERLLEASVGIASAHEV